MEKRMKKLSKPVVALLLLLVVVFQLAPARAFSAASSISFGKQLWAGNENLAAWGANSQDYFVLYTTSGWNGIGVEWNAADILAADSALYVTMDGSASGKVTNLKYSVYFNPVNIAPSYFVSSTTGSIDPAGDVAVFLLKANVSAAPATYSAIQGSGTIKKIEIGKYPFTVPTETIDTTISGFDFVADMKLGWNLGDTFDSGTETGWVNVVTTKAMIDKIKAAGFNTMRLPVTWGVTSAQGGQATASNNYTIRKAYLDRVEEVLNYAISNDMYVIINTHHDEWVSNVIGAGSETAVARIWEQLSARFKDYDEHVIFETLNEPRKVGSDWVGDAASKAKINTLNQIAVNTIRASGGNNAYRFIMVPGYAAHADYSALSKIVIPTDTVSDRIIVSTHAYTPGDFSMPGPRATWGTDEDKLALKSAFECINEVFIKKGIPVVMGEFGTPNKNNESARALHAKYYVALAKQYGITCVWWDNNAFNSSLPSDSGQNFGLFNRSTQTFTYPLILQGMIDGLTWTPVMPAPKTYTTLSEINFASSAQGVTVKGTGSSWITGKSNYQHVYLNGVGMLEVNLNFGGGWEFVEFGIPAVNVPTATALIYEVLIPKNGDIGLDNLLQFSTQINWSGSGKVSGLSFKSFNDDYFILTMEEDLTHANNINKRSNISSFIWVNYGWACNGPIYLKNVKFVTQ